MKETLLTRILNAFGVDMLMSFVKYPSILTYHNLGERGSLVDSLVENKSFDGPVYLTEKIDGSNSFICLSTDAYGHFDDYFIGSRKEPLYFYKDRCIVNSAQGIAANLKPIAERLIGENTNSSECLFVFFGETYGGKINGWKQYTSDGNYGWRVFDIIKETNAETLLRQLETQERVSSWRESGEQAFVPVSALLNLCESLDLTSVPYLACNYDGKKIPLTLKDAYSWLQQYAKSQAVLSDTVAGHSEGVVVRTESRDLIRKLRFEDYEKTKRKGVF